MKANKVKQLWREGKSVAACWLVQGDPFVAEIVANLGFDAVLLDMQHGIGVGPDRAAAVMQAINTTDTMPMVRVPWNDPVHFQYVLDAGAYGVIVPLVNSPEEAARAAGACRYPPVGYRSTGPNRVTFVGGSDYHDRANDEIICLVMIETMQAIEQIDAIAQVPGIDGFFIGPGDLAISLGLPPNVNQSDSRHADACRRVLESAQKHGLVCGIAPGGPADAKRRQEQGFNFCPMQSDWGLLAEGAANALSVFRG